MLSSKITRRSCLKSALGMGAVLLCPTGSAFANPVNEKLNIGFVGVGGRGGANLSETSKVEGVRVAALCDIDENTLNNQKKRFAEAKTFVDYRELLATCDDLDALVCSTADHAHAPVCIPAMRKGLHCYCEKPLTHDIAEGFLMGKVAAEKKRITHMGTTAQSSEGAIQTVEVIRNGDLGDVKEVHISTDRPIWPQGFDRPEGKDPIPANLHWDLFLNSAPERDFKAVWPEGHPVAGQRVYTPFVWRGWQDFGTGALGDIAPHSMNFIFWALELGMPNHVEVVATSGMKPEMFPDWSIIRFDFPAKGARAAMSIFWYDGKKEFLESVPGGQRSGTLIIGTRGRMGAGGRPVGGEYEGKPYEFPEKTLPRRKEIHQEWVDCIRENRPTGCPFEYSGPFTSAYLLGNIALKMGTPIDWDDASGKISNSEAANQYVRRPYRKGFEVEF